MAEYSEQDRAAVEKLRDIAGQVGIDIEGGKVRRTSSRFCLGVEHGDYNGTELFGVGTDRFIWLAYKPNGTNRVRLFSGNVADEGVVDFEIGDVPAARDDKTAHCWARFPYGVDYILRKNGYQLDTGIDCVLFGNIPGGGMSRSASLSINLILSMLDANGIEVDDGFKVVDMAQAVENEYIGSPCGQLDQIMIYFAKEGMGTHYNPKDKTIDYVKLGAGGEDLRIFVMDTGTDRPGLDKSTYKVRRAQCEELARMARGAGFDISCLGDVKGEKLYNDIVEKFGASHPGHCDRLKYIYESQGRFYEMMEAWKGGDIEKVGAVFRADGVGLRDDYDISGGELESMCDIVRTVEGVLGERMLGGGDKGAAGALVRADAVDAVKAAVDVGYPRSRSDYKDKYATHVCKVVDGIKVFGL